QDKSALSNILVNEEKIFEKNGEFNEIFKESEKSLSQTKKIQEELFNVERNINGK
ncbi:17291_t:CDS:1, partial [Gigaspora rosea]